MFDPLVTAETARAGLKLLQEHVGEGRPVTAVIYSHDHADHWGGVRGIVDEADVRSGKVAIIAPDGFMEALVSENVFAGNAMNRRLFYQYGMLLPRSPYGYVSQGLGQGVSAGAVGLIAPTKLITKPIEEIDVDGVRMVFQLTPYTEAPTEMNTWLPGHQGAVDGRERHRRPAQYLHPARRAGAQSAELVEVPERRRSSSSGPRPR